MTKRRKFGIGQILWRITAENSKLSIETIEVQRLDSKLNRFYFDSEWYNYEDCGILFFEKEKKARKAFKKLSILIKDKTVYYKTGKNCKKGTIACINSVLMENSVYDVVIQLSGINKAVSIREIGNSIFSWNYYVDQNVYVFDSCDKGKKKEQVVKAAKILKVDFKRKTIKVGFENQKKLYSFDDCGKLFFTREEKERKKYVKKFK